MIEDWAIKKATQVAKQWRLGSNRDAYLVQYIAQTLRDERESCAVLVETALDPNKEAHEPVLRYLIVAALKVIAARIRTRNDGEATP